MDLKHYIRTIPDFPKPGIRYYDISTLLMNSNAWRYTIDRLAQIIESQKPDRILGIESRGLMVAAAVAYATGCAFTMIRKKNKLPGAVIRETYALEYGEDCLEIQADAITPGQKVVIIDDLLAVGGTMATAIALTRKLGGNILSAAFIIELSFLNGKNKLDVPYTSLVSYAT